jgi:hypothetical protein
MLPLSLTASVSRYSGVKNARRVGKMWHVLAGRENGANLWKKFGKFYRRRGTREQAQKHFTTATTLYRAIDRPFWLEQAETEMLQLR